MRLCLFGQAARLLSRGYNFLVRVLFRLSLRDVNFGFKAMRKSLCDRLRLASRSPFVDAEMLIQAKQSGYRISEVAVPFLQRAFGVSRIRRFDVIAWTLIDMVIRCVVPVSFLEKHPRARRWSAQGLVSALLTIVLVSYSFYSLPLSKAAAVLALLLSIIAIARLRGRAVGLVALAFSAVILSAAFFPPVYSIRIERPQDRVELVLFLLTAMIGACK